MVYADGFRLLLRNRLRRIIDDEAMMNALFLVVGSCQLYTGAGGLR